MPRWWMLLAVLAVAVPAVHVEGVHLTAVARSETYALIRRTHPAESWLLEFAAPCVGLRAVLGRTVLIEGDGNTFAAHAVLHRVQPQTVACPITRSEPMMELK